MIFYVLLIVYSAVRAIFAIKTFFYQTNIHFLTAIAFSSPVYKSSFFSSYFFLFFSDNIIFIS